jgi:hypothetical protein
MRDCLGPKFNDPVFAVLDAWLRSGWFMMIACAVLSQFGSHVFFILARSSVRGASPATLVAQWPSKML